MKMKSIKRNKFKRKNKLARKSKKNKKKLKEKQPKDLPNKKRNFLTKNQKVIK